jgi:putative ABC transport system substrate-binding protein
MPVRDPAEIEQAIVALARERGSGLVVMPDSFAAMHRDRIVSLATQHRLPTIGGFRYIAAAGGLISYGIDINDLFRRSAVYIDRILKGANPAELPAQSPVKFELVVNLKTARSLGLSVSQILLARADEVIE